MQRGRSRSKRESVMPRNNEELMTEFISQRSEGGKFVVRGEDVKLIEELTGPMIPYGIASSFTSLVQDPNVSDAIFHSPSFQNLVEKLKLNPANPISPQNLVLCSTASLEGEDFEQVDEIDDKYDVLTSNSSASATVSTPKRSPRSSVSRRVPEDYDSDEDDLGISRTTHIGDDLLDDDPPDEGDSSDDVDYLERVRRKHHHICNCTFCGRSNQSSPKDIPIPPKRNRSTSTSSFGAGSPPQSIDCPTPERNHFAMLSLGFVSMALIAIILHSGLGNSKLSKDLIAKSLPWLMEQVSHLTPH